MPNLRSVRKSIVLALLAAGAGLVGCEHPRNEAGSGVPDETQSVARSVAHRIQSVTLDARRVPSDHALRAVRDLGVTHLTLVSFAFQESASDPAIRFSPDVRWHSESENGARSLARRARELEMGIILKPQVWIRGGAWTADIDFDTERQWAAWESGYREYVMHTARLAHEIDAHLLVVGTELSNPVKQRPEFWRKLIGEVRTVYDGRLTYAANWHDDYLDVPFWGALDVVGVQAYFPLSSAADPDLDDITAGWRRHVQELQTLSTREGLPVLFTELGYRSVDYAAEEPWRWPARDETAAPDYRLQADLYRGFFETFWHHDWFEGAVIWKYYPEGSRRSRGRELDFTPQGKPAEDVLRTWFTGRADRS